VLLVWDAGLVSQNAIGKKNRVVRLTCRSDQQRRDW